MAEVMCPGCDTERESRSVRVQSEGKVREYCLLLFVFLTSQLPTRKAEPGDVREDHPDPGGDLRQVPRQGAAPQ